LAGLLLKLLVAWFVPNGKGFEQNFLKLWAGFGRGIFLEQIMALSGSAPLRALMLSTLSFQQL
jgi:hypothetical protein